MKSRNENSLINTILRYQDYIESHDTNSVRFRTVNVVDNAVNGEQPPIIGKITMASILVERNEDFNTIEIGLSFCSPKDFRERKYDKYFGQEKAILRLFSVPRTKANGEIKRSTILLSVTKGQRIIDAVKEEILAFAKEKRILWMKDITSENLK